MPWSTKTNEKYLQSTSIEVCFVTNSNVLLAPEQLTNAKQHWTATQRATCPLDTAQEVVLLPTHLSRTFSLCSKIFYEDNPQQI